MRLTSDGLRDNQCAALLREPNIRNRSDGSTSFDDTGRRTWLLGRPLRTKPGLLLYIRVDSVPATVDAIVASGGEILQPIVRGRKPVQGR